MLFLQLLTTATVLGLAAGRAVVSSPSTQKVTSSQAFKTGAGNKDNAKYTDGTGDAGKDAYKCYHGGYTGFPDKSKWVEFEAMFNNAKSFMKTSCADLGSSASGKGDSDEQIGLLWNSIQQVAEASLVDHRLILAIILQESSGCVNVRATKNPDSSQPDNPGLMQSVGGVSFVGNSASTEKQQSSITQMVIDGTQGTAKGDGLVQCINTYGDIYSAARCYNSGAVNKKNLNDDEGATASYVNDIANRMTGWMYADSKWSSC